MSEAADRSSGGLSGPTPLDRPGATAVRAGEAERGDRQRGRETDPVGRGPTHVLPLAAGHLTGDKAYTVLSESTLRLCVTADNR